jgi:hypothetical protein
MINHIENLFGHESNLSRQKLENNINKFWVSNDFMLDQDALLKPGEETPVSVRLDKSLFPEL